MISSTTACTSVLDVDFTATFIAAVLNVLGAHVLAPNAGYPDGLLHGVAAERFAKLLVEQHFNERGDAVLLLSAGLAQRLGQFRLGAHRHAFQSAAFGHFGEAELR